MFKINIKTDNVNLKVKQAQEKIVAAVKDELTAFGFDVERDAKNLVPVNEGYLRNSIGFVQEGLGVKITVGADYAAYLEFGTRGFAAAHLSTLPPDWQTFAARFKGGGGGTFDELLQRITLWVKQKGIEEEAAYPIAKKIQIKGIRAQPYLYPAIEKNRFELAKRLKAL